MFTRLNVARLLRAQYASVRDQGKRSTPPDVTSRAALVLLPALTGGAAYVWSWPLKGGAELMGAFSLTAGVMLAVFALLAGWRTRLAERVGVYRAVEESDRSLIDEAVRHALGATLACVLGAALSLAASALTSASSQTPRGLAAICYAVSAYVGLLIVVVVVLAHDAYTDTMASIESAHASQLEDADRQALERGHGADAPGRPTS